MSLNIKPNTKKSSNIIRNTTFINDKLLLSPISKYLSSKNNNILHTKMSYNPYASNFKKIFDIENDEYNSDDLSQDTTYIENREKQLKILNMKYAKLYKLKEKNYEK